MIFKNDRPVKSNTYRYWKLFSCHKIPFSLIDITDLSRINDFNQPEWKKKIMLQKTVEVIVQLCLELC